MGLPQTYPGEPDQPRTNSIRRDECQSMINFHRSRKDLIVSYLMTIAAFHTTASSAIKVSCAPSVSLGEKSSDELADANGFALFKDARVTGNSDQLDKAVQLLRDALCLRPAGHSCRDETLDHLATALQWQFKTVGSRELLDESLLLHKEALLLRPPGHTSRASTLANFANALTSYYGLSGDTNTLNQAIAYHREGLQLRSPDDDDRFASLANLAHALQFHFDRFGDEAMLLEAIQLHREALPLCPAGHIRRVFSLSNLANILRAHYEEAGDTAELIESVDLLREASKLCPPDHPVFRAAVTHNLSGSLRALFNINGSLDILAEVVELQRSNLSMYHCGHPDRPLALFSLASGLEARFDFQGDIALLDEAVEIYRETLRLRAPGEIHRDDSLCDLGRALWKRAKLAKKPEILEEAIGLHQEALQIRTDGHPDRGAALISLGESLLSRHELFGDERSLMESVEVLRASVDLTSCRPTDQDNSLASLARALLASYKSTGNIEDFSEAIRIQETILKLRSEGHPLRHQTHCGLARLLLEPTPFFSWAKATGHVQLALSDKSALHRQRMQVVLDLIATMERALAGEVGGDEEKEITALQFYIQAVQLLPRVANFGLDPTSRLRELLQSSELCRITAVRAMLLGQGDQAIEIIEQGKSVFWMQSLRLRDPVLDTLVEEERNTLQDLFAQIESSSRVLPDENDRMTWEKKVEERCHLNEKAEKLIDKIRARQGFERFLQTPSFSTLAQAAANGPVVFLFSTSLASFALIMINPLGDIKPVRLTNVTPAALEALSVRVASSGLRMRDIDNFDHRDGDAYAAPLNEGMESIERIGIMHRPDRSSKQRECKVLHEIWIRIVSPILNVLQLKVRHSRLFSFLIG
jgi:tetratricopeptide (TPR) repeat protein